MLQPARVPGQTSEMRADKRVCARTFATASDWSAKAPGVGRRMFPAFFKPTMHKYPFISLTCAALAAASLHAQDGGEKITYQDHVRPMLENKCFSCHSPDKKKGDLDLTRGMRIGGPEVGEGKGFSKTKWDDAGQATL